MLWCGRDKEGGGAGTPVARLLTHEAAGGLYQIYCVYRLLHSICNDVNYIIELAVRRAMIARHVGDRTLAPEALACTVPT